MGKGKKKGGKGRGAAAEGGGDTGATQSTQQPESQPSSSQARGGGDARSQETIEEKSNIRKSEKNADGNTSHQQFSQKTPRFPQQQPAQRPPAFGQRIPIQQTHPGFQQLGETSHPQHPSGMNQPRGPTIRPQSPSGMNQPRGPPQQQQHRPPGFHQSQSRGRTQQQHLAGVQQGMGSPQRQQQHQQQVGQSQHYLQQQFPGAPQPLSEQQHQRGAYKQQFAPGAPQPLSGHQHQRGPSKEQHASGAPQPLSEQQHQRGPSKQQSAPGAPQPLSEQQHQRGPSKQQFDPGARQPLSGDQHQRGPSKEQLASGAPQYLSKQQHPRGPSKQEFAPGDVSRKEAPSQSVEKFIPRAIVSLQEQMAQTSMINNKKSMTLGTKGRKIQIETNYLKLDLGKLKVAYHYDVDIVPDIPKKFMRSVMEEFRKKHFNRFHPAFDGRKNLYSPKVLVNEGEELSDEIKIMDEMNNKEKIFKVKVQFANTVDLTPLHSIRMTTLSPQEAIQCVEIVLRSAPSSRCISAGRSFFTRPAQIIDLGEGMEMYQGFYQSVVRGWKPLLNVDVAHKAFPKEIDLVALTIELCSSYYHQVSVEDLRSRGLADDQKRTLEKFLKTLRVVYEIRGQPGSKREYRVNGIKECPRRYTFRPDNGAEMTIENYFASKKNYRLQYPLMPTIWVGNPQRKDPILLPAELCTLVPGQAVNRKMTENQTSAMIRRAATSTDVRKGKIMNSLEQTRHNDDLCIREFGFTIGRGFEQVQARVLQPPPLEYFNGEQIQPSRGVWRADNVRFLDGAKIQSWTIISACGPMDNMARLADMIFTFGPKCGMSLMNKAEPPFESIRGRPPRFGDIMACLEKCSKKKYDLVFVIIPDSGPTYSDVKRAAELNIGCLTQCIKRNTLFKKLNPATVNNILLKVNSKLNGTNHCLRMRPQILSVPCMIMGADVTHPSPDSQNIPSVAAVTASHDPKAFRYNICCRLQSPKTEIITDLQAITKEHLMYFHQMNRGQKPQRIVFFRDGVSEGQFNEVLAQEVRAIRNACTSLQNDYNPKITFLVVQKRHHTRFFPKDKRDSEDKNCNVPAGTCVDTDITNPNLQDFYLVSHASIQGVAKPTKYCTLWDDNDMGNDEIEALTYHLCHLFTRCNRSVSYPAPTYYAHLAAARAKVYIENINIDLNRLDNEQNKINIMDIIRKNKPMFFV